MKKIIAIVIVGLLITAALTCPDRQQHHDMLKGKMSQVMKSVISEQIGSDDSLFGFGLATIGSTLASKLIENVVESTLEVHDYFLFSTGEVTVSGNRKTVSIGVFNHVFPTFDEDDISKAIDDAVSDDKLSK